MRTKIILTAAVIGTSASIALAQNPDRGDQPPPNERPPRQGPPPNERPDRPDRPDRQAQKYSIEQAASDTAQLHTIAFSGLAFITGDFGASTFMPPGKVCDFFGFQYMGDIDAAQKGHNPMFLNRVAGNVLQTLNDTQKKQFLDLADEQAPQLEALARMRLPLIKSFHRQLDGQIPAGSEGLNRAAVVRYTGELFAQDAELSLRPTSPWWTTSAPAARRTAGARILRLEPWHPATASDRDRRRPTNRRERAGEPHA
jgi:hypothetical protein